ncbi:MAG: flavodoxin domain-containing protein [Bacteroidales bacterium]|jgi:menaquinone-dependent protoporphyrinogen IX oxidase|nr:flavodoxin domain-containing protein [Bacteroidales bacterium]
MSKAAIIYHSKYGHTKQYAQWIAEALNADIYTDKYLKNIRLEDYDTLVFGSGMYAGANKAAQLIVQYFNRIRHKKVLLFTCGALDVSNEAIAADTDRALNTVLTPEIRAKIRIFHLRGGIDFARLSWWYRLMLKFPYSKFSKIPENERNASEKSFLSIYGKTVDFTNKAQIEPIVKYCKSI